MGFFRRKREEEELLIKRSELIYRVMEMIYANRGTEKPDAEELMRWFRGQAHAESEYIDVGIENRWIERAGAGITITPYGRGYEVEYWKTFR